MSQHAAGNIDVSKMIKKITFTPTRATKYRKILASVDRSKEKEKFKKHTPSEALSIFVEANLSKKQYCYPKKESMNITETCAEVNLQDLLDHTSLRFCKYLEEVIENLTEEEKHNLELISKWGCDGSQQSQFKQLIESNEHSDANIFQS
jgi:hypothetical protein